MEPVVVIIVPGVLGGLVIALLFFAWQRHGRPSPSVTDPFERDPLSTDVINVSSIKVAGIGGLGLVAMAATVALNVPRIGQVIGLGLFLGAIVAAILILRRRKTGSLPSSRRGIGANTTLAIDQPRTDESVRDSDLPRARHHVPAAIPGR